MRPFQRGFFCTDETLSYPYNDCTISIPMLLICMLLLPLLFISVIEIIRICSNFQIRRYLYNLWRNAATFSFGFISTYLTTELMKRVIGRLRPHFFAACQPRLQDGSNCEDSANQGRYIERYICTNRNLSTRQLRELQVSFPSAHSSLSFFAVIFLCFYLHTAWKGRGLCRFLRHLLQFILLLLALAVAMSRITDYWHHWTDVLAGAIMGVIYAVLAAVYVGDFLSPQHNYGQQQGKLNCKKKQKRQQQQQTLVQSASDYKLQTVLSA